MSDPLAPLKSAASGDGNVAEKLDKAGGTYKDKVTDNTDTASKLGTASMPMAPDPTPFSIGPLKK